MNPKKTTASAPKCVKTSVGVTVDVWVVPGGSRSRVCGLHGDALKVAVSAPPEKGRANEAVREVLAAFFGLALRDVEIAAGPTARRKKVFLRGGTLETIKSRMNEPRL